MEAQYRDIYQKARSFHQQQALAGAERALDTVSGTLLDHSGRLNSRKQAQYNTKQKQRDTSKFGPSVESGEIVGKRTDNISPNLTERNGIKIKGQDHVDKGEADDQQRTERRGGSRFGECSGYYVKDKEQNKRKINEKDDDLQDQFSSEPPAIAANRSLTHKPLQMSINSTHIENQSQRRYFPSDSNMQYEGQQYQYPNQQIQVTNSNRKVNQLDHTSKYLKDVSNINLETINDPQITNERKADEEMNQNQRSEDHFERQKPSYANFDRVQQRERDLQYEQTHEEKLTARNKNKGCTSTSLNQHQKLNIVDNLAGKIENINMLLEKQHKLREGLNTINGSQSNYSFYSMSKGRKSHRGSPLTMKPGSIIDSVDDDLNSEEIEYCSMRDSDNKLLQQTKLADKQIAILKAQIEKIEKQKMKQIQSFRGSNRSNNEFSQMLSSDCDNAKSFQQSNQIQNSITDYSRPRPDECKSKQSNLLHQAIVKVQDLLGSDRENDHQLNKLCQTLADENLKRQNKIMHTQSLSVGQKYDNYSYLSDNRSSTIFQNAISANKQDATKQGRAPKEEFKLYTCPSAYRQPDGHNQLNSMRSSAGLDQIIPLTLQDRRIFTPTNRTQAHYTAKAASNSGEKHTLLKMKNVQKLLQKDGEISSIDIQLIDQIKSLISMLQEHEVTQKYVVQLNIYLQNHQSYCESKQKWHQMRISCKKAAWWSDIQSTRYPQPVISPQRVVEGFKKLQNSLQQIQVDHSKQETFSNGQNGLEPLRKDKLEEIDLQIHLLTSILWGIEKQVEEESKVTVKSNFHRNIQGQVVNPSIQAVQPSQYQDSDMDSQSSIESEYLRASPSPPKQSSPQKVGNLQFSSVKPVNQVERMSIQVGNPEESNHYSQQHEPRPHATQGGLKSTLSDKKNKRKVIGLSNKNNQDWQIPDIFKDNLKNEESVNQCQELPVASTVSPTVEPLILGLQSQIEHAVHRIKESGSNAQLENVNQPIVYNKKPRPKNLNQSIIESVGQPIVEQKSLKRVDFGMQSQHNQSEGNFLKMEPLKDNQSSTWKAKVNIFTRAKSENRAVKERRSYLAGRHSYIPNAQVNSGQFSGQDSQGAGSDRRQHCMANSCISGGNVSQMTKSDNSFDYQLQKQKYRDFEKLCQTIIMRNLKNDIYAQLVSVQSMYKKYCYYLNQSPPKNISEADLNMIHKKFILNEYKIQIKAYREQYAPRDGRSPEGITDNVSVNDVQSSRVDIQSAHVALSDTPNGVRGSINQTKDEPLTPTPRMTIEQKFAQFENKIKKYEMTENKMKRIHLNFKKYNIEYETNQFGRGYPQSPELKKSITYWLERPMNEVAKCHQPIAQPDKHHFRSKVQQRAKSPMIEEIIEDPDQKRETPRFKKKKDLPRSKGQLPDIQMEKLVQTGDSILVTFSNLQQ